MALVTLTEYKTFKGITVTTYDGQISALLAAVEDAVKKWCNRDFEEATYEEQNKGVIDARGFFHFRVKNNPIDVVNSLKIRYYGTQTDIDIDVSQLDLFKAEGRAVFAGIISNGIVIRSEYLNGGFFYTINYDGGYASGSVPESLKLAIILATSDNFNYFFGESLAAAGDMDVKSMSLGDYSISYETKLGKVETTLDKNSGVLLSPTVKSLLSSFSRIGQSTP